MPDLHSRVPLFKFDQHLGAVDPGRVEQRADLDGIKVGRCSPGAGSGLVFSNSLVARQPQREALVQTLSRVLQEKVKNASSV